jgi:hypothetical protein
MKQHELAEHVVHFM